MTGKLCTAEEAALKIGDGDTLYFPAFAEEVTTALEERFLKTGHPSNLEIYAPVGISYFKENNGLNRFAHPGMVRRVVSSHIWSSFRMRELIAANECEAYILPLGVMSRMFREIAAAARGNGPGGILTKVGLGTFVDPREGGGKANERTKEKGEDLVKLVEWNGEEYLFYPAPKLDSCILSCTTADEKGNATSEDELISLGPSPAIACKACGGTVIAQVQNYAKADTLYSRNIAIPGIFVDHVVVEPYEKTLAKKFVDWGFGRLKPEWTGEVRIPFETMPPMPHSIDKVTARVALTQVTPNSTINFGFGQSTGVIYLAYTEEGLSDLVTSILEIGIIGGVPGIGEQFACTTNPEALTTPDYVFDYIWGGGFDYAFLAFAETDSHGNANVSRFGDVIAGPGGFVDISHNAKNVCFVGTFTTGAMKARCDRGKLEIEKDGDVVKFKKHVQEITFNAKRALASGNQKITIATERALFEITNEGLLLKAIAPGIDLQKHILDKMEFEPIVPRDLELLDEKIYKPEPMGLREKLLGNE